MKCVKFRRSNASMIFIYDCLEVYNSGVRPISQYDCIQFLKQPDVRYFGRDYHGFEIWEIKR